MLKTISPLEMKRIETRAIEEGGQTGEQLMQRAAAHVAQAARRFLQPQSGHVLAVCGTGNNGGDGIAALRMLCAEDSALSATLWLMDGALSPDCTRELARLQAEAPQAQVVRISQDAALPALPMPSGTGCIVDALFGTGLSRPLTGAAALLCEQMSAAHKSGTAVISVDIPSGLHGESGEVMGAAVHATETVTFHRPKPGLWLGMGPSYAGRIRTVDIGIPAHFDDAAGFHVLQPADLSLLLPPRNPVSHKGSYGRVLVIAGSRGMAGAAALCATAALRTGAGLVTVACPDDIVDTVQTLCPCATCIPLPLHDAQGAWEALLPALSQADAASVGCGLGTGTETALLWEKVMLHLHAYQMPAILDADGLNLLAQRKNNADACKEGGFLTIRFCPKQILTPHPAEAARLLRCTVADITKDAPSAARLLAKIYGTSVLLKGATSVMVSNARNAAGEALGTLGTPALAKGGSGDVLTGVLAALLANAAKGALSLSALDVMQIGCALHGLAGQAATKQYGERGVLATDVCAFLGRELGE